MDIGISVTHLAPADEPDTAQEIARRMLPAYTVDGGTVRLSECRFVEQLFLRLEFRRGRRTSDLYVDARGRQADPALAAALSGARVVERADCPDVPAERIDRLIQAGVRSARQRLADLPQAELVSVACVWCRFVEGTLEFRFGRRALEAALSGWACLLKAPPVACPCTGRRTFHLATTDDGRIAAAEQIEACAETGRRVLADELVTCAATGQRVVPEAAAVCPVTGQTLLRIEMAPCHTCGQEVSREALDRHRCAACRKLRPVSKADPRLVRLLEEYPSLDRWSGWLLAETATVYVFTARRWLRRVLVVADKETLELRRLAGGSRLFSAWTIVPPSRHEAFLRG